MLNIFYSITVVDPGDEPTRHVSYIHDSFYLKEEFARKTGSASNILLTKICKSEIAFCINLHQTKVLNFK